jgi:cytochrome c-type biogenesis protein CcmF
VFIPLTIPLAMLMGLGVMSRWKRDSFSRLFSKLWPAMVFSLVIGLAWVLILLPEFKLGAVVGTILAVWVFSSSITAFKARLSNKDRLWPALLSIPLGFYGMTLAHMGVGVFIIGITLTSIYSIEKDIRLSPGETYEMAEYTFRMDGVKTIEGPNFIASQGMLTVSKEGEVINVMQPEKRIYRVQRMPMTEAAIDAGLGRDLFVALGEQLDSQGAWSVRLYVKPYIRWIWLGTIIMALGGLLAASDRRYRMAGKKVLDPVPAGSVATGAA